MPNQGTEDRDKRGEAPAEGRSEGVWWPAGSMVPGRLARVYTWGRSGRLSQKAPRPDSSGEPETADWVTSGVSESYAFSLEPRAECEV